LETLALFGGGERAIDVSGVLFTEENLGEDLYGKVKVMVENGAWHKSIGNTIDQMVNKVLQEKVMSGSFLRGNHLTLTPDVGVKNGKFLSQSVCQ